MKQGKKYVLFQLKELRTKLWRFIRLKLTVAYRVELEAIEQVDTVPLEEKKKQETNKIVNTNGAKEVPSPIQGQVTNVKVKVGDKVKKGDVLVIIEAMKLENEVVSPFEGQIAQILVTKGQNVKAKEVIITIE